MFNEDDQETLDLFAEYLRERGSRKRGAGAATVSAQHISSLVSAVRIAAEREQRCLLTHKADNLIAPLLFRHYRREDGPPKQRKLSRGIRAQHLRKAAAAGYDRTSPRGLVEWAVATLSLNLLLRGGEVGVTKRGNKLDPARDITFSSFEWMAPCAESRLRPWLAVDVLGIKDSNFKNKVVRMLVCRRHRWEECPRGGDPACAYDAVLALWEATMHTVALAERQYRGGCARAFFINEKGEPWCTRDSQHLAQKIGACVGFDPNEVGGKAFRIGGATDMRDVHGGHAQLLIKERGRWASDVAQLYQRALLSAQLDSSAGMAAAESRDLEEALAGWSQPATYYTLAAAA